MGFSEGYRKAERGTQSREMARLWSSWGSTLALAYAEVLLRVTRSSAISLTNLGFYRVILVVLRVWC